MTRLYLLTLQGGGGCPNESFKDLASFLTYRQDKLYKQEEEKYNPVSVEASNWKLHVVTPPGNNTANPTIRHARQWLSLWPYALPEYDFFIW